MAKTTGQTVGSIGGAIGGFLVGGVKGASVGASLGYSLGTMIDPPDNDTGDMPAMANFPIQRSNLGTPIAKVYGTEKVAGNVLWMGENHPWQRKESSSGGKGGGGGSEQVVDSGNRRSFLIGICEGPVIVLRIWKGKEEIDLSNATFFRGDGSADTGINALTGEEFSNYPNTACAFFNEFEIGNSSLPNFTFEVTTLFDASKTQIYNATDLQNINDDLNGDYELLADIDLTGIDWTPLGDVNPPVGNPFTGTFDGRYHTVSNLTLVRTAADGAGHSNLGLFARAISPATIKNLKLENFNITGRGNIGALVGGNWAGMDMFDVHVNNVTLTSNFTVVGWLHASSYGGMTGLGGNFIRCSVTNFVINADSFTYVGALSGVAQDVWDSFARGTFNYISPGAAAHGRSQFFGGLGGDLTRFSTRCYASMLVPVDGNLFDNSHGGLSGDFPGTTTADLYWDTEVSDETLSHRGSTPAGATGKTTAQMFQEATFVNFDFDNIWKIDEGVGYPTLRWVESPLATDENPAVIIKDLLTNDRYGAGLDESTWIDTASFSAVETYCDANGLLFSFSIDSQRPVKDWIKLILDHFGGKIFPSEGKIKLIVLKEESSVSTLTQDNLMIDDSDDPDPPVEIQKRLDSETANRIELAFRDRDNDYNTSIVLAMDEVEQRVSGRVRKRTVQLPGIHTIELAKKVVQRLLFNALYRFSTYNFPMSYKNMLNEVGDVITLSDGSLITSETIRVTSIEEEKDGRSLAVQAIEEKPYIYEQFTIAAQESERVRDGAPTLVDASATFTESINENGFIISIVPGGADTNAWTIYKSFDDVTYEVVGQANIDDPAASPTNSTGTTTSPLPIHATGPVYAGAEEFLVNIGTVTVLDTAITDDAFFNNQRLCKIGSEIMAYKTCVQTATAGIWKVTGLIRGLFGTEAVRHEVGETFWTINADFTFGFSDADIGKTIYFKFLTIHGTSVQNLADVSGIPYVIQGNSKRPMPVSLMRIQGREGLGTYETDDVVIDFYFASKTAGFNIGGHGDVLWNTYVEDASLIGLRVDLEEEDETAISSETFNLSLYEDEPFYNLLESERDGKNPVRIKLTPINDMDSIGTKSLLVENI